MSILRFGLLAFVTLCCASLPDPAHAKPCPQLGSTVTTTTDNNDIFGCSLPVSGAASFTESQHADPFLPSFVYILIAVLIVSAVGILWIVIHSQQPKFLRACANRCKIAVGSGDPSDTEYDHFATPHALGGKTVAENARLFHCRARAGAEENSPTASSAGVQDVPRRRRVADTHLCKMR